ncbi:hypothetical protein LINPERPRIM_LOCUS38362 [Linum perenne]
MEESLKRDKDGYLLKCMNILDEMEVDDTVFKRTLNYLHEHPSYQKPFMLMPDNRRRGWLEFLKKKYCI